MKTFALSGLLLLSIVLLGAADPQLWTPFQRPNSPIGEAKGISPGRVTWIRDVRATPWDGKTGKWWEPGNIDETVLSTMISKSLRALTGAPSDREAWDGLFRHFNRVHGRGDRGWQPGELVAVKINVNNTYSYEKADNNIDQSPQATRALLRQLTEEAGVAQKDIVIYDASVGWKVRAMPDRIYVPLHHEFSGVRWVDGRGLNGREAPDWVEGAITYTSPEPELGYSGVKQFPKGSSRNSDNYLVEAARGTNAKLGPYKPNGVVVGSLGVHEHWDNPVDKKYSRNLSADGKGIELVVVR
jgi:hypothetical protein